MLNRLSGTSLRLRVGLGAAMLSGGVVSLFAGWGWLSLVVATVVGAVAAYKTPDIGASIDPRK
jgi:uncharacterized membrane protein YjjP (DUF1212 family)